MRHCSSGLKLENCHHLISVMNKQSLDSDEAMKVWTCWFSGQNLASVLRNKVGLL